MHEDRTRHDLVRLARNHKRSAVHLTTIKSLTHSGKTTGFELLLAVAAEATARTALLDWKAPTPSFAIEKLLHILAHVISSDLMFDNHSLETIREELGRFGCQ